MKLSKTKRKFYVCSTDWHCEMDPTHVDFPELFWSVKDLKKKRSCWKECGIVELELKMVRIVKKGTV